MYPSALRNLAASYRGGFLDQDQYREQRRQWLRDLQAGRVTLSHNAPEPNDHATMPAFPYTEKPEASLAASGRNRRWLIPVLILLVLAGIWLGWLMLARKSEPVYTPLPPSPVENLGRNFLDQRDWSSESILQLNLRLSEYAKQQELDPQGNWLRRLRDAAAQQLAQAQAVAELGDGKAAARLEPLGTLLGILSSRAAGP